MKLRVAHINKKKIKADADPFVIELMHRFIANHEKREQKKLEKKYSTNNKSLNHE